METKIYNSESEWNSKKPEEKDFLDWENSNNVKLPEEYKSFMEKYNGGRIYPLIFKNKFSKNLEIYDDGLYLDPLFSWDYVVELYSDKSINWTKPEKTLVIGGDPGRIDVIISLRPEDHGKIYSCIYTAGINDDEPKIYTALLANSFREFIFERLYENSDNDGYEHWYIPDTKNNSRKVEF